MFRLRAGLFVAMCIALILQNYAVAEDRYFDSNGVSIHYTDQGEGEPVVLMHGLNGDYASTWFDSGFAQSLMNAGYRVLALDARAHGLSGAPHDSNRYGPEMSLDIARLLDHVGIEKAHVVGYSMGARIVGKLREMRPDVFISLTLGGYGLVKEDRPPPSVAELADSLERGGGFMPLYRELYPAWTDEAREARSAAMVAALPDVPGMVALLRGLRFRVSEESLRANTVPTLAIVGALDPRKQAADELVAVMQNLELVVIPETDHAAADNHPVFLSSLLNFLERHSLAESAQ